MKFEIDADIPAGFEPTGEYRYPRSGEWVLTPLDGSADRLVDTQGCGRRLILREKPLAYEDFEPRDGVRVELHRYPIMCDGTRYGPAEARGRAAALLAAAYHVDRVNAQKNNRA